MSRFSRAFDGALKAAGLQQADAAAIAGYHTSMVSRLLKGRSALSPKHVKQLLLAIQNTADRAHCLTEFLYDCCPEDDRRQLIISLGQAHEARAVGQDELSNDLAALERLAENNDELKELFSILVQLLSTKHGRDVEHEARVVDAVLTSAEKGRAPIPPAKKRVLDDPGA